MKYSMKREEYAGTESILSQIDMPQLSKDIYLSWLSGKSFYQLASIYGRAKSNCNKKALQVAEAIRNYVDSCRVSVYL